MSSTPQNFTTPVGRLVQGSLYKGNDKNAEGAPLLVKNGPNAGKPRQEWYIAVAIPKDRDPATGQIRHWAATEWGSKIWQVGHAFMGTAGQMPAFAWKVRDGDSQVPNRKGKKPADQEGFPGCWVLSFASGFPPQTYTMIGVPQATALAQPDAINLGDYVQVNANVVGNDSTQQPGVFINMSMVCLVGYGQRIFVGPDVASAGFGGQPLPPGASLTPLAAPPGAMPVPAQPGGAYSPAVPPPGAIGAPSYPPPPGTSAAPIVPPAYPSVSMAPPNPAILQPPPAVTVAMAPVVRPHVMTPKAQGATYEQMRAAQWTDDQLIQHGMMLP